jgi:hypothetical protein
LLITTSKRFGGERLPNGRNDSMQRRLMAKLPSPPSETAGASGAYFTSA